jgi:hypothetical protein
MGSITRAMHKALAASAAAIVAASVAADPSAAQKTSAAGQLTCDVAGGVSFFIGSSRALDCVYQPARGAPEYYKGTINKIGIDIGFKTRGVIVWDVISPGLTRGAGALAGNYVGVTADIAAGLGVGANALLGGNKIVLQPISVSGSVGLNVAAGIGDIELAYVGGEPPDLRETVPFGR